MKWIDVAGTAAAVTFIASFAVFVLATAWKFAEEPFRRGDWSGVAAVAAGALVLLSLVAGKALVSLDESEEKK